VVAQRTSKAGTLTGQTTWPREPIARRFVGYLGQRGCSGSMNWDSWLGPKNSFTAARNGLAIDQILRHQAFAIRHGQTFPMTATPQTRTGQHGTGSRPNLPTERNTALPRWSMSVDNASCVTDIDQRLEQRFDWMSSLLRTPCAFDLMHGQYDG